MISGGGRAISEGKTQIAARLPDPGVLDHVVAKLRDFQRRAGIERTLAIGELILNQFFGGDPERWRDRRRNKNNSVRRLANSRDCPFSKSALNEAVAVHVASLTMPCVRTLGHIGASHVTAVLGLPAEYRETMLIRADSTRASVRELRHQVVAVRRTIGERRGRPALEGVTRALSLLRKAITEVRESFEQLRTQPALDDATRAELYRSLEVLGSLIGELKRLARTALA
jgi:hypothetical protein